MIIFEEDGVAYFVYKDRKDVVFDFTSFCSEMHVCKNETSAIRKHLLMQVGILEEE